MTLNDKHLQQKSSCNDFRSLKQSRTGLTAQGSSGLSAVKS